MITRLTGHIRGFLASGIVIGSRATGVLIGFATQIFLARLLSAADLGVYFTAISLAAVLAVFCTVGYPMIMPRFVSEADRLQDGQLLQSFLRRARTDWLIASLAITAIGLAIVYWWPDLEQNLRLGLMVAVSTAPFLAALRINGSLANAQRRFALGFVPDLLLRPVLLACLIACAWYFFSATGVVTILLMHAVIALLLAAWQYKRVGAASHAGLSTNPGSDTAHAALNGVRKRAAFMLVAMLFVAVVADVGILSASVLLSKVDLAIFAICLKISAICGFAVYAVQQVAVRDTADALLGTEPQKIRSALQRVNMMATFVAITAFGFIYLFGELVLEVFGPQYVRGFNCLLILMGTNIVAAFAGPVMQIIGIIGEERNSSFVFLIGMAGLFVLNLLLIPAYGLEGAGMAFLLVMTVCPLMLGAIVRKKIGAYPAGFSSRI